MGGHTLPVLDANPKMQSFPASPALQASLILSRLADAAPGAFVCVLDASSQYAFRLARSGYTDSGPLRPIVV